MCDNRSFAKRCCCTSGVGFAFCQFEHGHYCSACEHHTVQGNKAPSKRGVSIASYACHAEGP